MRLGQLARQLDIKPEKIISFLKKEKEISIKEHPNAKVDDELIDEITSHFKPVVEEVIIEEKVVEEAPAIETPKEEPIAKEEEITPPEHIETVKPEAFAGPKIIGKIDLPDKTQINVEVDGVVYDQETLDIKKKESLKEERERRLLEKEEKEKAAAEAKEKARVKREADQAKRIKQEAERIERKLKEKAKKDALLLEEEEKKRKALAEARKQKQKEHYNQNVQLKSPSKKVKPTTLKESSVKTEAPIEKIEEVKETSFYKRFIKWLNT